MNPDAFKHIERLFHELLALDQQQRADRLETLRRDDPARAASLAAMLGHATSDDAFLDATIVASHLPELVDIPLDGSVVLGGRYRLVERIGMGGSSTVLRATMTSPDRDVAVKVLRIGLRSSDARERFERESQVLAELTHPHVAHIYETGVHTFDGVGVPWIAMELVREARTLGQFATDPAVSTEEKRSVFMRILDAIRAAHEQEILHLDINSTNVLIDRYGHPKVIDFGLAGLMHAPGAGKFRHAGTRVSMAPEQTAFDRPQFDEQTDIYALALLYIELIHSVQLQAFEGQSDEIARERIRNGKARELLGALQGLDDTERSLLDDMLRVDPGDRPSSVQEVVERLTLREPIPNRGRRWLVGGGVMALVLLAAVSGMLLVPRLLQDKHTAQDNAAADPQPGTLSIPMDLAMELSLQNPRTTEREPSLERAIEGIAEALRGGDALPPEESARLHAALGDRFRAAGRNEESIEQYTLAMDAYETIDDPDARDSVRMRLTDLLLYLGRYEEAQREIGLVDRSRAGDPVLLLDLSIAEARLAFAQEQDQAALNQLHYALDLAGTLDPTSRPLQIERLVTIAQLAQQLDEHDLMNRGFARARTIAESLSDESPERVALVDMAEANAIFRLDLPETHAKAIELAHVAVDRLAQGRDRFHHAWGLRQTGHMYLSSGDAPHALDLYTQAYDMMRATLGEDHHETVVSRGYQGLARIVVDGAQGDGALQYELALRWLREHLGAGHGVVTNLQDAAMRVQDRYGVQISP